MEGPGHHDVGHGDDDEGDQVLDDQASHDIGQAGVGRRPGLEKLKIKDGKKQLERKNRPNTTNFEFLLNKC